MWQQFLNMWGHECIFKTVTKIAILNNLIAVCFDPWAFDNFTQTKDSVVYKYFQQANSSIYILASTLTLSDQSCCVIRHGCMGDRPILLRTAGNYNRREMCELGFPGTGGCWTSVVYSCTGDQFWAVGQRSVTLRSAYSPVLWCQSSNLPIEVMLLVKWTDSSTYVHTYVHPLQPRVRTIVGRLLWMTAASFTLDCTTFKPYFDHCR